MVAVANARHPVSLLAKHPAVLQISSAKTNKSRQGKSLSVSYGTDGDFLHIEVVCSDERFDK